MKFLPLLMLPVFQVLLLLGPETELPKEIRGEKVHSFVVYPADTNHHNTLFGGKMLAEMDRCAGIVTRRFLYKSETKDAVTVAINGVRFFAAAEVGDLVVIAGEVSNVGTKSVTVWVTTWRETPAGTELLAEARYVFCAVDLKTGKAVPHGLDK